MKVLLAICMLFTATFALAADMPASHPPVTSVLQGKVLEIKNVETYTYLRLKTQDGEIWAAINKTPIKKGATVTIENAIVMKDFKSKTLNKTFPMIIFGNLAGSAGAMSSSAPAAPMASGAPDTSNDSVMGSSYPLLPSKQLDTINEAPVPKATGPNAYTVGEVMAKGAELKDKTVQVRGRVVKYNPDIMGKNWVHLRDGSGSATDYTNDILVTTSNQTKLGEIVTAKGVVHTDKDFGAGYAYKVLIEEATLQ